MTSTTNKRKRSGQYSPSTGADLVTGASLTHDDYTVGWISALEIELTASEMLLDIEHPPLPRVGNDINTYTLGRIGRHNVVLAGLPMGEIGLSAATITAVNLLRTFPKIRFALMVGLGGGAPGDPSDDANRDIRLGDVVVSMPEDTHGKEMVAFVSR